MFHTPAHKQVDPAKFPGQIINRHPEDQVPVFREETRSRGAAFLYSKSRVTIDDLIFALTERDAQRWSEKTDKACHVIDNLLDPYDLENSEHNIRRVERHLATLL